MRSPGQAACARLEDVTSFDLLHDDLLTFLLDESAGQFDALVCWTTGFERNYMQTYQQQRYAARLSLTDDHNETYALQDGRCVQLVGRYLDAVRSGGPGACPVCRQVNGLFDGLYPFNVGFVQRLYENLISGDGEQRRTPRQLLDRAVKGNLELAARHGQFPPLRQVDSVQDLFYDSARQRYRDEYPGFVATVTWYGERQNDHLTLPRATFGHLGVAIPEELGDGDLVAVQLERPMAEQLQVRVAREELDRQNRFKSLRLELQSWYHHGAPLAHYADLQRGAYKVLQFFRRRLPFPFAHPSGAVGVGAPVVYGRDKPEANVLVQGARMQPQRSLQVVVGLGDDLLTDRANYAALEAMLTFHVFGRFSEETSIPLLDYWSERAYARYREAVEARLYDGLGVDVGSLLLFAKLLLLNRSESRTVAEVLADPVSLLRPTGQPVCEGPPFPPVSYDGLLSHADHVDGALRAMFFVSRDVLDYPKLLDAVARLRPMELVKRCARIGLSKVDEDLRFGDGRRVRELVQAMKAVCQGLDGLDVATRFSEASERLRLLQEEGRTPAATLVDLMRALQHRLSLYALHELYDAATWRRWEAALDESGGAPPSFAEASAALGTLLLSEPGDALEYISWAGRTRTVLARPDVRLLAAALDLADGLWHLVGEAREGQPTAELDRVEELRRELERRACGTVSA